MATRRVRAAPALVVLALLAACRDEEAQLPNRANFTAAVADYLAQRGHLCIARYDWPVAVPDADRRAHGADTRQMQMLESLGLVTARAASATVPAHDYTLTSAGEKYYLHVPVVVATATQRVTHPGDFCVASLALDRVFGWEAPRTVAGRSVSSVLFSYRVLDPAPWLQTPDARLAFPMARRAIDNAGTLQLRLGIHLGSRGWIADELSD